MKRIDLVGITLEIYGPTPHRDRPLPGIDQLIQLGRALGPLGTASGEDKLVKGGAAYLAGQAVPEQWLVGGVRLPYQKFNRNPQGA